MKYRLEVFVLPVSDVDRAKEFYARCGFHCDVDHDGGEHFRVVQFTPPGSACSITFGIGMPSRAEPGQYSGIHLVVNDVEAAVAELRERGIDVSDPYHFGETGQGPGVHPERIDFGSYASFDDPDGNSWLLVTGRE
ncbi:VOC family protein [Serinicoccus kebangsaanensis]|uniref:VOC family protein n=1 Tax=Serinicoccus kebangsaanensis TaxID=2602069 RepID=UPI00124CE594|nr:VOC family protein [Serinicoccus kebangsaanensis]